MNLYVFNSSVLQISWGFGFWGLVKNKIDQDILKCLNGGQVLNSKEHQTSIKILTQVMLKEAKFFWQTSFPLQAL